MIKVGIRAYLIELTLFFSYAFFAVNWIAGTVFTKDIMVSFGLTTFTSATLISIAITVAKIIGNLMAAWILVRLQPKWSVVFASSLIVIGSVLAVFASQYWIFVAMRFILGFGGALLIVYFGPFVVRYFTIEQRPLMNGINAAAYTAGSILAMIIVDPVFAWQQTWQGTLLFFSGCSAVLLLLWFFVGENFPLSQTNNTDDTPEVEYTFKEGLKDPINYSLPFTYSGFLLLYLVILTIFPLSENAPLNPKTLSTIVALSALLGSVAGILLTKRYPLRLPVVRVAGLMITGFGFILITASSGVVAVIGAIGLGISLFLPMTALMTIPQELPNTTPTKVTLIMGFFWSFAYILETIAYYGIGMIIDAGGFQSGLYVAVGLSLTCFIGSFLLPETGKK